MKNKIIIFACFCSIGFLAACSGDHASNNNSRDTQSNTYGARDTSKVDTGKMKAPDNGAAGGTTDMKDTTKK